HDLGGIAALEDLVPLGLEPPRRRGIDNAATADRCLGAQNEPVAAGGDNRLVEAQLREAAGADDPHSHVGGAEMYLHRRGNGLELVENDVEPIAHGVMAGVDERVAAAKVAALD